MITLIIKFKSVPGGMILSGFFLGGMLIAVVLVGCLIVAYIIQLFFKSSVFLTNYFLTVILSFVALHYYLYSPTLTIVVPANYNGKVDLVLSNVDENILKLDSNGIGYINQWTFDHTYSKPVVVDDKGNKLDSVIVGFSPGTFWAQSKSCCIGGKQILSKSFSIKRHEPHNEFLTRNLLDNINKKVVSLVKPDEHPIIQTEP